MNGWILFNVEVMLVTQNLVNQNRRVVSITHVCANTDPFCI